MLLISSFRLNLINSTGKPVDGILRVDYELGVVEKKVNIKPEKH